MAAKEYAYAVGRIRALENRLITATTMERLLGADSLSEAIQILAELEYGGARPGADYEVSIDEELAKSYRLLKDLAPDSPELDVMLFKWDLHNLKLLTVMGENERPSRLGTIPWERLQEMVANAELSDLPEEFGAVLHRIDLNGPAMAAELDKAYYSYGRRVFGDREGILRDYWFARLDLINLRTFVRMKKVESPMDELKRYLVEPGYLALGDWLDHYNASWESVVSWLALTPYQSLLKEGVDSLTNLSNLEREIDIYLIEQLAGAKRGGLGIEPLVSYLSVKETEARNIRLILAGKANRLPTEQVRRRLRHGYL